MNKRVIPVHFMTDWKKVKRTWKERLLARPWNPFKSHKKVWDSRVYMTRTGVIYVSFETYEKWDKLGILDEIETLREN